MSNWYVGGFAVFTEIEEIVWSFYRISGIIKISKLGWIWTLKSSIYAAIGDKSPPIEQWVSWLFVLPECMLCPQDRLCSSVTGWITVSSLQREMQLLSVNCARSVTDVSDFRVISDSRALAFTGKPLPLENSVCSEAAHCIIILIWKKALWASIKNCLPIFQFFQNRDGFCVWKCNLGEWRMCKLACL